MSELEASKAIEHVLVMRQHHRQATPLFRFFAEKQTLSPVENSAMYEHGMRRVEVCLWPVVASEARRLLKSRPESAFLKRESSLTTHSGR